MLSCELSRMEQMFEAIMKSYNQKSIACPPVVFLRYNCDNAKLDGTKIQSTRAQREELLLAYLKDIADGKNIFSDLLNIAYINYDTEINEEGVAAACVMDDPDYNDQMRAVVRAVLHL